MTKKAVPYALLEWIGGEDEGSLSVVPAREIFDFTEEWIDLPETIPGRVITKWKNIEYIAKLHKLGRDKQELENVLKNMLQPEAEVDETGGRRRKPTKRFEKEPSPSPPENKRPKQQKPTSSATASAAIVDKYLQKQVQRSGEVKSTKDEDLKYLREKIKDLEAENTRLNSLLVDDIPAILDLRKENTRLKNLLAKDIPDVIELSRRALKVAVVVNNDSEDHNNSKIIQTPAAKTSKEETAAAAAAATPVNKESNTVELAPGMDIYVNKTILKTIKSTTCTASALVRKLLQHFSGTYDFSNCNVKGGKSRTDADGKQMEAMDASLRDALIYYVREKYPASTVSIVNAAMNGYFSEYRSKKK